MAERRGRVREEAGRLGRAGFGFRPKTFEKSNFQFLFEFKF